MRKQVGLFAEAEQFKENLVSSLVYRTCIDELLQQDKEIDSHRRVLEKFPEVDELADVVSSLEIDLEVKWRKASMLFEGIC